MYSLCETGKETEFLLLLGLFETQQEQEQSPPVWKKSVRVPTH